MNFVKMIFNLHLLFFKKLQPCSCNYFISIFCQMNTIRCNTLISCFFCFQYYHVLKRKKVRMIFFCNLFFDSFCLFYSRNPVFIHSGIWHYKWRHTDKLCIRLLCNFFQNGFITGFKLLFFRLFPVFIITPTSLHPIRMLTTSGRFKIHSFSNIRFTP